MALLTMTATQADKNSKLERVTLVQQSPETGGTLHWLSPGECLCRQSLGYQKLFMARTEAQG